MLRFHVLPAERSGRVLSSVQHDELLVMWLSGGLSGVGWVVAGGFEKERLRETEPLFFCYQGSWGYWQVGWRVPPYL